MQLKREFFNEIYHKQNEQIKFTNLSGKTLSRFITLQSKFKTYSNLFFLHYCKIKTLENFILICFFVKKENFEISSSFDQVKRNVSPYFVSQNSTKHFFDVFKHSVEQNVKQKQEEAKIVDSFQGTGGAASFALDLQSKSTAKEGIKNVSYPRNQDQTVCVLNWKSNQFSILQSQMLGPHNERIGFFQKTYQFKNKFLGYTKCVPSFIFNFAKFEFLPNVFGVFAKQKEEQKQRIDLQSKSDIFLQGKKTKNNFVSQEDANHDLVRHNFSGFIKNKEQKQKEDNPFLVDHFAEGKDFIRQNLVSKSQLRIIFSSQETYNFSQDKISLSSKKQLFVWQNIQNDILWHKYSIEKSKFNLKNSERFLPEIEYQLLLPFYNANPYYLHLQNKTYERSTFFFNSLRNVKDLKKNLQPVNSCTQNLILASKLRKKKEDFLQSKSNIFDVDVFNEIKNKEQEQQHKGQKRKYQLQNYQRSNQATCLHQYPAVEEGNWVEKGDLIANCSASALGELALGKNILLAYMPWDGYNFEDAILISDRLVNDDVYTSIHIERYEISVKDTEYGLEQITANIPDIPDDLTHLNENGVTKIGSWVKEGDILVGKITPIEKELISPYQKLFYSIIEKPEPTTRDTSLRVPKGIQGRVISYEIFEEEEEISLENFDLTTQLQEETNFPFSSNLDQSNKYSNNIFPFRGFLSSPNRSSKARSPEVQLGVREAKPREENGSTCLGEPLFFNKNKRKRNNFSFSTSQRKTCPVDLQSKSKASQNLVSQEKIGANLENKFNVFKDQEKKHFLSGSKSKQKKQEQNVQRLRTEVLTKKNLLINSKTEAKDIEQGTEFFQPSFNFQSRPEKRRKIKSVHLYIVEKRKIQVGDKLAGRHGNKGIVSRILSKQDMPYLPDGTSVDMVLNPLGVPSRMNVGQVFECLLGLAAGWLGDHFKITPFDEIYGSEASRSLVYLKLYQARLKTGQKWLFNPQFPGKVRVFDGRTGDRFDQAVTIGRGYILKLVHMVDEKIHARSTGPYSLVTQQPVRGRSKGGGQRVGEMEVWALEGFGAAYALQELLTVKSDDVKGRRRVFDAILKRKRIFFKTPESFKLLVRELQCLCLDVGIYVETGAFNRTKIDVMDLP